MLRRTPQTLLGSGGVSLVGCRPVFDFGDGLH